MASHFEHAANASILSFLRKQKGEKAPEMCLRRQIRKPGLMSLKPSQLFQFFLFFIFLLNHLFPTPLSWKSPHRAMVCLGETIPSQK
jgi:hypothetical protein